MTTRGPDFSVALGPAAESTDAKLYRAVQVNGTLATASANAVGICMAKVDTGYNFTVAYFGQLKGVAGAAINSGAVLGVASGGWVVPGSAGTAAIGRAIASASSGDFTEFLANFLP